MEVSSPLASGIIDSDSDLQADLAGTGQPLPPRQTLLG